MSIENDCEAIEVLLLKANATLATFSVVRFDEDTEAQKDRIVVKASPKEVSLAGISERAVVVAWLVPVSITVHLVTRSQADMDSYMAAIHAANNGTAPASVIAVAAALFPNGINGEDTNGGEREHEENKRVSEVTFNFIVKVA